MVDCEVKCRTWKKRSPVRSAFSAGQHLRWEANPPQSPPSVNRIRHLVAVGRGDWFAAVRSAWGRRGRACILMPPDPREPRAGCAAADRFPCQMPDARGVMRWRCRRLLSQPRTGDRNSWPFGWAQGLRRVPLQVGSSVRDSRGNFVENPELAEGPEPCRRVEGSNLAPEARSGDVPRVTRDVLCQCVRSMGIHALITRDP